MLPFLPPPFSSFPVLLSPGMALLEMAVDGMSRLPEAVGNVASRHFSNFFPRDHLCATLLHAYLPASPGAPSSNLVTSDEQAGVDSSLLSLGSIFLRKMGANGGRCAGWLRSFGIAAPET